MRDDPFLVFQPDEILLRAIDRMLRLFGERVLLRTVTETQLALEGSNAWAALVIDVDGGSGFDILKEARKRGCSSRALLIAGAVDETCSRQALALDASIALRTFQPATLTTFVAKLRPLPSPESSVDRWVSRYGLTPTESEILIAAANGGTHIQIAHDRMISPRTLQKHVENLLRKTQDDTLAAAAARVLRETLRSATT